MMMRRRLAVVSLAGLVVTGVLATARATEPYWVKPMRLVNYKFWAAYPAEPFKVARWGDEITRDNAFFKPFLHNWNFTNLTWNEEHALQWLRSVLEFGCWTWQDDAVAASHGAKSGSTSAWPLENDQVPPPLRPAGFRNIDYWLATDKPMFAVIMWGTNDVADPTIDVTTYTSNMRQIVQTCKTFGTVPILTTIPPRMGYETQTAAFAQAIRNLAVEQQVPLIDYNQEILNRQPTDWDMTLIPGPAATQVPPGDGVHPSVAVAGYPDADSWKQGTDFSAVYLNKWGYTLRNWMTLNTVWEVWDRVIPPHPCFPPIKVYDIAASDVPGPQPIRTFPIPQAAKTDTDELVAAAGGWADAEIAYDNWAEGLVFSNNYRPDWTSGSTWSYSSIVSVPIIKPKVIIHDAYNAGSTWPPTQITTENAFIIEDTQRFYVTQEGSTADPNYVNDNRYPYRVPRLACDAWSCFMAVLFEFPHPVKAFGVFVPAASNNGPVDTNHDQNFCKQVRSVYVSILDETNIPMSIYTSLKVGGVGTYCPFVAFVSDGVHGLKKVSIIHDQGESGMGVGGLISIMDAYIIPGDLPLLVGDINKDGYVNVGDLQAMVAAWGSLPSSQTWDPYADLNTDNYINVGDLQLLVEHWGEHGD